MTKKISELYSASPLTYVTTNTHFAAEDGNVSYGVSAPALTTYMRNTFAEFGAGFGTDNLLIKSQGTGTIAGAQSGASLDDSANLTINTATLTGGQIVFPATQNASSNANTLDDYEEGTWSPVCTGLYAVTVTSQGTATGKYTKIGDLVFATFEVYNVQYTGGPGVFGITGLPFSMGTTNIAMGSAREWNFTGIFLFCDYATSTSFAVRKYDNTTINPGTGCAFTGSFCYKV